MYDLIINTSTVERVCKISLGVNPEDFKKFISEAQEFDLKQLLSEDFYIDLLENYTESDYQDLICGNEYTFEEKKRYFLGLEQVLSYFSYGRYLVDANSNSTSFGMPTKTTNFSTPNPQKELEQRAQREHDKALQLFEDVKIYLDRNSETFEAWKTDCSIDNSPNIEVW